MTIYEVIALLIGVIALIIAFVLFRKIGPILSKDKPRASRVMENVAAGLLATVLYVVLEKYINAIHDVPPIDFQSGWIFLKSVGIALGSLFIMTAIMLAVIFFAVYVLLKPVMKKKGQK